jgi:hypothetical protein
MGLMITILVSIKSRGRILERAEMGIPPQHLRKGKMAPETLAVAQKEISLAKERGSFLR